MNCFVVPMRCFRAIPCYFVSYKIHSRSIAVYKAGRCPLALRASSLINRQVSPAYSFPPLHRLLTAAHCVVSRIDNRVHMASSTPLDQTLQQIFERNDQWAREIETAIPDFFPNSANEQQRPKVRFMKCVHGTLRRIRSLAWHVVPSLQCASDAPELRRKACRAHGASQR